MVSKKRTARHRLSLKDACLVLSRLDFPSIGTRVGLWVQAADCVAKLPKLGYVVINTGLVSHIGIRARIKGEQEHALAAQLADIENWENARQIIKARNKEAPASEREKLPTREDFQIPTQKIVREDAKQRVLDEIVAELAELIPVFRDKRGRVAKIYCITSSAPSYDGPNGAYIAEELSKKRSDFVAWSDEADGRLPIKGMFISPDSDEEHNVLFLGPDRAVWGSKHASAGLQKIEREKRMQSAQRAPSLVVVGGLSTRVHRPEGAGRSNGVLSIGALHNLQRVRGADNQVSYTVIEFSNQDYEFTYIPKTYTVKDEIQAERKFVKIPDGATDRQAAILGEIKRHPRTIGQLADALPWARRTIEAEIIKYNDADLKPTIVQSGSKFDIDPDFMMRKVKFPLLPESKISRDTFIAWSCQHSGSVNTQYDWFSEKLPELILKYDIENAINAGDQQEGLKHDLERNGELIGGLNYSTQQVLAGVMPGDVIVQVFASRMHKIVTRCKRNRKNPFSQRKIENMVHEALMQYYHRSGNHDQWVLADGHTPLAVTHYALQMFVYWGCRKVLDDLKLTLNNLMEVVSSHIQYGTDSVMPSGLSMSNYHPHQGRSLTWSAKAEQAMWYSISQLVIVGNYHDSVSTHMWDEENGQRMGVQLGTIKSRSLFEENMNKRVDNNVAIFGVDTADDRIKATWDLYIGPKKDEVRAYSNMQGIPTVLMDAMARTFPKYDPVWKIVDCPDDVVISS